MLTVRGVIDGNSIELFEDAPVEGRAYVLVTILEGSMEIAAARGHAMQRDVLHDLGNYSRYGSDSFPRFTVGSLMTREVVSVKGAISVAEATHLMRGKGVTSVIVKPENGNEWGIMTMRDVLREIVGHDRSPDEVTVGEIATRPLIYVSPDMSLHECSKLLVDRNIRRAVVKQNDAPIGIISDTDIFLFVEEHGWGTPMPTVV